MRRAVLAILALLPAAVGCRRDAATAVIGYAAAGSAAQTVRVVEETLREESRSGPAIRIVFDSLGNGGSADAELARAQRLVGVPGLVGVVGHAGSRGSLVAAPLYNNARITQIEPTGTSRLLREAGPWTLRLAPDDSVEGAFIARFVTERLAARRVSVLYQNDEYGSGIRDGVVSALRERGIAVQVDVPVDSSSDIGTLLDVVLATGRPDVVVSGARGRETGLMARELLRRSPRSRVVAGDGALALPALPDAAGSAADSIYVVSFWMPDTPDSLSRAFVARYRQVAGADPYGGEAMSHDGLMVLAHAVRSVGQDPEAIRRYLQSLGRERPPYRGVTGPIAFGRDAAPRLVMTRLVNGLPRRVPEGP